VRLLLDAHVSSRHVGRKLVRVGHDVLALDQNETLARLADEDVLALSAAQQWIVITPNVRHFVVLARVWAEARRSHAGMILVTLPHTAYGALSRRLDEAFSIRPAQADWIDRVEFVGRG